MQPAPLPFDENERIAALRSLKVADQSEERFDRVTRLAVEIFQVPIAFVSLIDRDRQWFKSKVGLSVCETARDISFCAHAILGDDTLLVPDTLLDPRFADNPLVTGEPHLRFYMGQPLRAAGGEKIGTLCIADHQPRDFSPGQTGVLPRLAALVEQELRMGDLIDAQVKLLTTQTELLATQERLQEELHAAATYLCSLLPTPIREPLAVDWRYLPSEELGGDCLGYHFLSETRIAVYVLDVCGHGVGAALLAVVLLNVLRSRGLNGVDFGDPAAVLTGLNREFPMENHGRFFTIWYGVVDLQTRQLTYSNAGHPPAILIDANDVAHQLWSRGIATGCVAETTYANASRVLMAGDVLYLYSDGLYELGGVTRRTLSLLDLEDLFRRATKVERPLDDVLLELQQLNGSGHFPDDVSVLELRLP
ncbi:MAG TPA: SpoIIE family protein phosphatase [Chthoniobacteraceae bacterium]